MAKCEKCKIKKIIKECEDCGTPIEKDIYDSIKKFKKENELNIKDCLHENCAGCKNGTCSGVHMIVCPCAKCRHTIF